MMKVDLQDKKRAVFAKNFMAGLGWMIGATLGFALFITLFSLILKWLGGLPVVGDFFAHLIDLTNQALESRRSLPR